MFEVPALHPHAVRYAARDAGHCPPQNVMVVIEPGTVNQACLDKAARIARAFGSSMELFSSLPPSDMPEAWAGGTTLAAYRGILRERQVGVLESLAQPLRASGLAVTTEVICTDRAADAIVEHAIRARVDLVVKEVREYGDAEARLIRELPGLLLLVRSTPWPFHPRICVAVDPCHPADRPASLDESMGVTGRAWSQALIGSVALVHALQAPPHLPGESVDPEARQQTYAHARDAVAGLAQRVGISADRVHCIPEHMPEGIVKLSDSVGTDLMVMGAGTRSRSADGQRTTASLVLSGSQCDVLIVKPPGFVSPVLEE